MIIEILFRISLQTFHSLRCTSNYCSTKKNHGGTVERQFVPSCGEKSFDISCIPNSSSILAYSLCGLIVGECDNRDEYPKKLYLFVKQRL
uniref:Uncharacterized protein n=1 Tax=Lactuca sativa TaxID=4236 RepID=A0A9R1V4W1_LACSA|nr:hypothetical protein LSAT_V11C600301280 [Lactuca sativa]